MLSAILFHAEVCFTCNITEHLKITCALCHNPCNNTYSYLHSLFNFISNKLKKKCKKHRTVSLNTEYFKCFATEPTLDLSSRLNQHNDDEDRQFDSHGKLS